MLTATYTVDHIYLKSPHSVDTCKLLLNVNIRLYEYGHEQVKISKTRRNNKEKKRNFIKINM